jgi:hypothetical protein
MPAPILLPFLGGFLSELVRAVAICRRGGGRGGRAWQEHNWQGEIASEAILA